MVSLVSFVTSPDYGMKLPILRSNPEDQILYQTERYNEETLGYEVPIKEEGDYVLVLKFAEVYFAQSQQKVRRGSGPHLTRGTGTLGESSQRMWVLRRGNN